MRATRKDEMGAFSARSLPAHKLTRKTYRAGPTACSIDMLTERQVVPNSDHQRKEIPAGGGARAGRTEFGRAGLQFLAR